MLLGALCFSGEHCVFSCRAKGNRGKGRERLAAPHPTNVFYLWELMSDGLTRDHLWQIEMTPQTFPWVPSQRSAFHFTQPNKYCTEVTTLVLLKKISLQRIQSYIGAPVEKFNWDCHKNKIHPIFFQQPRPDCKCDANRAKSDFQWQAMNLVIFNQKSYTWPQEKVLLAEYPFLKFIVNLSTLCWPLLTEISLCNHINLLPANATLFTSLFGPTGCHSWEQRLRTDVWLSAASITVSYIDNHRATHTTVTWWHPWRPGATNLWWPAGCHTHTHMHRAYAMTYMGKTKTSVINHLQLLTNTHKQEEFQWRFFFSFFWQCVSMFDAKWNCLTCLICHRCFLCLCV